MQKKHQKLFQPIVNSKIQANILLHILSHLLTSCRQSFANCCESFGMEVRFMPGFVFPVTSNQ